MKHLDKKPEPAGDGIKIHGFYRLRLTEGDGDVPDKIVGDSGWCQNTITNEGFDDFLCRLLAAQASSKQVNYIAIGTGTAPNVTHSTLDGEIMASTQRKTVTVSVSGSKTVRFTATFYSSDNFLTGASNLRNIGLFESNATDDILFAGSTYASSSCNTNQNVEIGAGMGQLIPGNLSKSGKPSFYFVVKNGNPEPSLNSEEGVETGWQASLVDEGTVQTTNAIN